MVEGLVIEGKGQGGFPWKKVKEFWGKVKEEYLVPIINSKKNNHTFFQTSIQIFQTQMHMMCFDARLLKKVLVRVL